MTRLPIKSIHINKSPIVVGNLKTLPPAMAQRWGIDLERGAAPCANAARATAGAQDAALWASGLRAAGRARRPTSTRTCTAASSATTTAAQLTSCARMTPQQLARAARRVRRRAAGGTAVPLPRAQLSRYAERRRGASAGKQHRAARLLDGAGGARTLPAFFADIDALAEDADERGEEILGALYDYAESIAPMGD